jgi:hypothetical protein
MCELATAFRRGGNKSPLLLKADIENSLKTVFFNSLG